MDDSRLRRLCAELDDIRCELYDMLDIPIPIDAGKRADRDRVKIAQGFIDAALSTLFAVQPQLQIVDYFPDGGGAA